MKKLEFKKMRRSLGTSGTTLKVPIIEIPEGEEEEQENENLFEQIMKENSPNMAKEIDFQEARESQRSWAQGNTHQGTS